MSRQSIAIGPEMSGIGSWEWVGRDAVNALQSTANVTVWRDTPPAADIVIFVKYGFTEDNLRAAGDATVVYMPIDRYASSSDLDSDGVLLSRCQLVLVHSRSLMHYFHSYAPTDHIDHAIRYYGELASSPVPDGPILWTGVRNNLEPVVKWANSARFAHTGRTLHVLTNLEDGEPGDPVNFGFEHSHSVVIENWSAERHQIAAEAASLAVDLKGRDFRQKHKPASKAIDCIASGLPLAMNVDSSGSRYLSELGFDVATPENTDRWMSGEYWSQTQEMARKVRSEFSNEAVGERLSTLIASLNARRNLAFSIDNTIHEAADSTSVKPDASRGRIAILSFLFNWPSTGGGIIHTVELAQFLKRAGYDVTLICPRFDPWQVGQIDESCPVEPTVLEFQPDEWNSARIRECFREAVSQLDPDHVLITDCWSFKPHLAEAVRGYSYFMRMQAHELLCPLNNLRLLPGDAGHITQCEFDQLASPDECLRCLALNGAVSGSLHQAERRLSAVGSREYDGLLRTSLQEATAVLALNPDVADRLRPFSSRVEVVTWGMDEQRFPEPAATRPRSPGPIRILFAGLTHEPIKGFNVLESACLQLWNKRQDFQLIVTTDPAGEINEFTRSVGWQTQSELPALYRDCDICVVPTIARDGLSRTSVEAMASGLPVVASRIGGLPYSVKDGVTGLLFEPGDCEDLLKKLEMLIDDRHLRERLGGAGRHEFTERFTWSRVIEHDYVRLFESVQTAS